MLPTFLIYSFFFKLSGDHRDLHKTVHSFPTRRSSDLLAPWLYSGSLLNAGVLLGGLVAALLSSEFAVRVPPRGELVKGAFGGLLMGVGAVLAFGCNIGGFFSATSALSLAGLGMMLGLGAGAFLGLRYLIWETEHRPEWW